MEHVFKVALGSNFKVKKSNVGKINRKIPDYEKLKFTDEDTENLSRYVKVKRLKLYSTCSLHDFEQFKYILNEKRKFNDLILDIKATIPLKQFQISNLNPNKEQIEYLFSNIVDIIYEITGLSFVIFKSRNIIDYRVFSKLYKCKQEKIKETKLDDHNSIDPNEELTNLGNEIKINSNKKKKQFNCNSKMLLSIHKNYGFLQLILQHKLQHEPLTDIKKSQEMLERLIDGHYDTIDVDNNTNSSNSHSYNYNYNSNSNVDILSTYNNAF